jgi:hypothetical protein
MPTCAQRAARTDTLTASLRTAAEQGQQAARHGAVSARLARWSVF